MRRVLVVDARAENRSYLRAVLTTHGWEVDEAEHGAEALAKARQAAPTIVVAGLAMPVMDGFTLLWHWKLDPWLRQVPFAVFSTSPVEPADQRLATHLGADALILSPADSEDVMRHIMHLESAAAARPATLPAGVTLIEDDPLKHYSETLIRKLEEKTLQLEQINAVLEADIAERQKAQRQLATSEALLRAIVENEPACLKVIDADLQLTTMNPAGLAMIEAGSLAEAQRQPVPAYFPPEHREAFREFHARVIAGEAATIEFEIIGLRGTRRWLEMHAAPLRDPGGGRTALLGISHDITERRRAAEALRTSEERFRQVVETINEVFWMSDARATQIFYVSPAYEAVWGRSCESLYADPSTRVRSVHPADRARLTAALASRARGAKLDETYRIIRPDGEVRWVHELAFPLPAEEGEPERLVGVAEDITERKRLESQFLRAQRAEAIGALAGGVAHDLNNILAPVLMVSGLLRDSVPDARDKQLLSLVEQSAQRGADVVRQLLTFSRGVDGARTPVQLPKLIDELHRLMRETFPREIALQIEVPADLWTVLADGTQIHQVLLNLCVNARDAMPQGGTLLVTACNAEVCAAELACRPEAQDAQPGPYVVVSVADTGAGMAPDVVDRIFEPFFTTKPMGRGTGLGLSSTMGIVRSHHGFICVYSELGQGSAFKVYLPAMVEAEKPLRSSGDDLPQGRGELILVVDDEAAVRTAFAHILERYGYQTVDAANGEMALAFCTANGASVCVILTDVMMPVMGGVALIRGLRTVAPHVRIVATSGLSAEGHRKELAALGITEFVPKPCSPRVLLEAVQRALAGPATASAGADAAAGAAARGAEADVKR